MRSDFFKPQAGHHSLKKRLPNKHVGGLKFLDAGKRHPAHPQLKKEVSMELILANWRLLCILQLFVCPFDNGILQFLGEKKMKDSKDAFFVHPLHTIAKWNA